MFTDLQNENCDFIKDFFFFKKSKPRVQNQRFSNQNCKKILNKKGKTYEEWERLWLISGDHNKRPFFKGGWRGISGDWSVNESTPFVNPREWCCCWRTLRTGARLISRKPVPMSSWAERLHCNTEGARILVTPADCTGIPVAHAV